jgi:hypothetical protein
LADDSVPGLPADAKGYYCGIGKTLQNSKPFLSLHPLKDTGVSSFGYQHSIHQYFGCKVTFGRSAGVF